jgi:hypothetical protein
VYAAMQRGPVDEESSSDSMLVLFDRRDLTACGSYAFRLARDVHSLLALGGNRLLAVSTGTDEVVELTIDGFDVSNERVRWRAPGSQGGEDTVHLNSLAAHGEQVLVSAFGRRSGPNWDRSKGGFVAPLGKGGAVLDGLSQPHSLLSAGLDLLLCESGLGVVRGLRRRLTGPLPGYTRGLSRLGENLLVGVSSWRRAAPDGSATGCRVLQLRWDTGQVLAELEVDDVAREIYDLLAL